MRTEQRRGAGQPPPPDIQSRPISCYEKLAVSDTLYTDCQVGEGRGGGERGGGGDITDVD